jgi:ankyrin repeat protein
MSESLPPRPHLNWLKNRAKERLAELRAAEPGAKLADAQLAIARAYGFTSWRALVAKVRSMSAVPPSPPSAPTPAPAEYTPEEENLLRLFRGAVNGGRVDEVRRMLETEPLIRASVNAPVFQFNQRPLAHAKRNPKLVDLLLAYGADINLKSAWEHGGWGLLDDADERTAEFLISRGAVVDIFAAAHLNRLERARELLDAGPALVHARGGDGCLPLHFAKTREMIDLLLDRGAAIDARCIDHAGTAAQWAVPRAPRQQRGAETQRSLERVRHLAERGATVDVFMAAALDDAERLGAILATQPEAIEFTVGGDGYALCPKAPGGHIYLYSLVEGKTAAEVAAEFGSSRCLELLRGRSTPRQRFLMACALADRAAAEAELSNQPGLLSSLTPQDLSRLPKAAFDSNAEAVALMLNLGFDPLVLDAATGTVLHAAAWQGQAGLVEAILRHPKVAPVRDKLVNAIESTHNSTPLGWCCHGSTVCRNPSSNYPEVARLLVAAGGGPAHNLADATDEVRAIVERRAP